jgi:hypothetical protein
LKAYETSAFKFVIIAELSWHINKGKVEEYISFKLQASKSLESSIQTTGMELILSEMILQVERTKEKVVKNDVK